MPLIVDLDELIGRAIIRSLTHSLSLSSIDSCLRGPFSAAAPLTDPASAPEDVETTQAHSRACTSRALRGIKAALSEAEGSL